MTNQPSEPSGPEMGPKEALTYLARIREGVYRIGYLESVQAMDMAIEALRREGEKEELIDFVRAFLWDFVDLDERLEGYSSQQARKLIDRAKAIIAKADQPPGV